MSHYTKLPITLKTGEVLPKGLTVASWKAKDNPSRILIVAPDGSLKQVRVSSAFKVPSMKQLDRWSMDSVCDSVLGNPVEPDGYDSEGSPSWLLALGLI